MERLERYVSKRKLTLNIDKSKVMCFKKGRRKKEKEKWTWMGKEIEEVDEFKYLGFTFYKNNSKNIHIEKIVKRGVLAIKQVWGLGERTFGEDWKGRIMLFDTLVKSFLLYASEMWGWSSFPKLEAVQNRYIKWILKLEYATPNYIVLEETKRKLLSVDTGQRAI